jgi:hypothetical protein
MLAEPLQGFNGRIAQSDELSGGRLSDDSDNDNYELSSPTRWLHWLQHVLFDPVIAHWQVWHCSSDCLFE